MTSINRPGPDGSAGWLDRILLGYFLVSAVAVFGLWAGYFADGTAAPAVFEPSQETGTLIGRTVAALAAGLSLAIAAIALKTARHWAPNLTLFGVGMVGYAALNTLGETLASGSAESVVLALGMVAAVVIGCSSDRQRHVVYLAAVLAGCAFWLVWRAMQVGGGSLTSVVTVTAWPGPHYVAEAAMALVTVWGLIAWVRGRGWGSRLALFGLGTYCYSTLNALDWAHVNDGTVVPILAVTLGAAVAGAVHLRKTEEIPHARRC